MKTRRSFLATVACGGAGLALANVDPAGAAGATAVPSSGAAAFAATMRERFDSGLTAADLDAIARAVDANAKAAAALNPRKRRLANAAEPVLRFHVTGGEA
jgi:hypothetical protein